MKCYNCSNNTTDSDKFCSECGFKLQKIKSFDRLNTLSPSSYTPHHLAEEILSSRGSMEGERKQVTVLFADVSGFTSIAEKLDPETIHKIMDGAFHILTETVHKYQGTINQFTGDGIMALFGAPLAIEENTDKACQAALEIQNRISEYALELATTLGIDFKMRIGINSGLVFVGSIGDDLRMDYTAIGDTTNLAARLEKLADLGTILVSLAAYKHTKNDFTFKGTGELNVKGKSEPLYAYTLIENGNSRNKITERMVKAILVGRDKELALLEGLVEKAIEGEGGIVNVIGEAGVGKSRLIFELIKSEIAKEAKVLEGRATTMDAGTSYYPLISLLRDWAEIKGGDARETSYIKLESAVRKICGGETTEIFPFVATLMGVGLEGEYLKRIEGIAGEALETLIAKHLSDLIVKISWTKPLIFIIEDLHWADESTLTLLSFLYRIAAKEKILFINTLRPVDGDSEKHAAGVIEESELPISTITLQPLDQDSSILLIDKLLHIKALPKHLKDLIVDRSEGNPFFIEEVLRSIIDEGGVSLKDGVFEVTDKIDTIVVPYTINSVFMSRLDRLDEDTKEIVKVASVIGRSFFYRILSAALEGIDDTDERLLYLKSIQIIDERRRIGEVEYFFKHSLAKEAVYQSITLEKRKVLHLKVAETIERLFEDRLPEFYGPLVVHYSKGGDDEKTEEYLIKAGEEALKSSGSSEALKYLREGLDLYLKTHENDAETEKIVAIEKNIAVACYAKGELAESIKYFDKVLYRYGAAFPTNRFKAGLKFTVSFLSFLISIYLPSLRWKKIPAPEDSEFLTLYFYKLQALTQVDPKRYFIESFYFFSRISKFDFTRLQDGVGMVGMCSISFSWTGLSFRISKKMLDFIKKRMNHNDTGSLFFYELYALFHNIMSGSWNEIKEYDQRLVDYALSKGLLIPLATYLGHTGGVYMVQGYYMKAERIVDELSEIADTYDNDFVMSIKYDLNRMLMEYGRLPEALHEFDEAIAFVEKKDIEIYRYYFQACKARAQIMLGDMGGAKKSLEWAEKQQSSKVVLPHYYGRLLSSRFVYDVCCLEGAVKCGDKLKSAEYGRCALKAGKVAIKIAGKESDYRTDLFRQMGICCWLIGRQGKAVKWWGKSIKTGERLVARLELSRTYMEVGKRLLEPGSKYRFLNGLSANDYIEKARTLFNDIGLEWDMNQPENIHLP